MADESECSDYIHWSPGNPFAPEFAKLKPRSVDFGPAASAGKDIKRRFAPFSE